MNSLGISVVKLLILIFFNKNFLNKIKKLKKYFFINLNNLKKIYKKIIKKIICYGLLIGVQLYKDQSMIIKTLMDNKLLTIRAAENVVSILHPLNVKKTEINQALKIIDNVCSKMR